MIHPGTVPMPYRVQPGDTPQAIARQVYGHSAWWYRIADANALTSRTVRLPGNFPVSTPVAAAHA